MLSKEREEVILAYRAHEWQDAFGSALAAVGGEIMLKSHVEEARLEAEAMFGNLYGGANKVALKAVCDENLALDNGVLLVAVGDASTQACGVRASDSKVCHFPNGEDEQQDLGALIGAEGLNRCNARSSGMIELAALIAMWAEQIGAREVILHDSIGYNAAEEMQLLDILRITDKKYGIVNELAAEIMSRTGGTAADGKDGAVRVWLWPKSNHFRQLQCAWVSSLSGIFFHVKGNGIVGYRDGAPLLSNGVPYSSNFESDEVLELTTKESTPNFEVDSGDEVVRVATLVANELSQVAEASTARSGALRDASGKVSFKAIHTGAVRDNLQRRNVAAVSGAPSPLPAIAEMPQDDAVSPLGVSPTATTPAFRQTPEGVPMGKLPPIQSPAVSAGARSIQMGKSPFDDAQIQQKKETKKAQRLVKKWREEFKQGNGRSATEGDYPDDIKAAIDVVKQYWREQKFMQKDALATAEKKRQALAEMTETASAVVHVSGAHIFFNGTYEIYRGRLVNGAIFYVKNPTFKGAPKTFLYRSALSGRWNLVGDEIGMETNSCSYTSTLETEYPYDSSLQFMEAQNNEWAVVSGMSVSTMIPAESAAPAPSEAGASSETPKDKKGNWCFPLLCCNGSSVAPKEPPS